MLDTDPYAPGLAYEASLDPDERKRLGAFYTPAPLAARVAERTIGALLDGGWPADRVRVCDPAVGGGALLVGAAQLLIARGGDPAAVAANLHGWDIDPDALAVAAAAVRSVCGREPVLRHGNSLLEPLDDHYDAVVINPPFLSQLQRRTVRSRADAAALSARWGDTAGGYADTAGVFMVLTASLLRPGGRAGLILPQPVLTTRDGLAARRRVATTTRLAELWAEPLGTFDAGVRAVVAIIEAEPGTDDQWRDGAWAGLVEGHVPPHQKLATAGTVGDVATVTADFRDQFYGVAAVASPDGAGAPLATCGLIDPARLRWEDRPCRLGGQRMLRPRADVGALTPILQRWAAARLVPKVMLATQTRILEAVADETGAWLPVVPVITLVPSSTSLGRLLAVLTAPPIAALARRTYGGGALSADAVKLSARQVATLPLPAGTDAWDQAASALLDAQRAPAAGWRIAVVEAARTMCAAYGVDDRAMPWWSERFDLIASRS